MVSPPDAWDTDDRTLGRMISLLELGGMGRQRVLEAMRGRPHAAHIIGLTGPPGAGKSTLAAGVAKRLAVAHYRVGVVAVDPTSPFSGGAFLGDRVRMSSVEDQPGVFIRSMASRHQAGGLARATGDVVDLLACSGFDYVIVETVGTGQGEIAVADLADTVAVVSVPGMGDAVQADKAGILEIADIHVVNKADRPGADTLATDLGLAAHLLAGEGWCPPVVKTNGLNGSGIEDLLEAFAVHRSHLVDSGQLQVRRVAKMVRRLLEAVRNNWLEQLLHSPARAALVTDLAARVVVGELDVGHAVRLLGDLSLSQDSAGVTAEQNAGEVHADTELGVREDQGRELGGA